MSVESSATYISQLNATLPTSSDPKSEGDDHLRLIKSTLQNQFPNLGAAAVTPTAADLNAVAGRSADIAALAGAATTGASIKVVTPVSSSNDTSAASTAFAQSLVAAAVGSGSPAPLWVSGNTYSVGNTVYSPITFQTYRRKVAGSGTTDPSLDTTNWQVLSSTIGTGGQTTTGSLTLTSSSAAAITVTPATPGLYVTLPDATTCSKADNLFAVYNAGDYDYGVKDSTGTQLGWIRARTGAMIGLSDNSTAAGVWAYYGLEKTGITASYVNSTLSSMDFGIRRVALDSNRTFFMIGTGYGIVYDASTQTWGSPTLIRALPAGANGICILSATNQVLMVSCNGSTAMEAVTCTISGTSITVNTAVPVTLAGNFLSFGQLIAVGSSFVVSYGRAATASAIRAITVSGTVPTIGAESVIIGTDTVPAIMFASGSIVRTVTPYQSANIRCAPYTVSGSTLTVGTLATVTTTNNAIRAFLNGNGNIVCHYKNTTHYATIFKLTGTTEAASSVSLGTVPTSIIPLADYIQATASKTVFIGADNTTWYCNILTDSAGTASAGTEISGTTYSAVGYVAGLQVSNSLARFVLGESAASPWIRHISIDYSGASPVLSKIQISPSVGGGSLPIMSQGYASDAYGVLDGTVLIAGSSAILCKGAASVFNTLIPATGAISGIKNTNVQSQVNNYPGRWYGVKGAANNESWSFAPYNQSNVGFAIDRVEAAA